jgi:hypothetical protein
VNSNDGYGTSARRRQQRCGQGVCGAVHVRGSALSLEYRGGVTVRDRSCSRSGECDSPGARVDGNDESGSVSGTQFTCQYCRDDSTDGGGHAGHGGDDVFARCAVLFARRVVLVVV